MAIELPPEYRNIDDAYRSYLASNYHQGFAWPEGSTTYPAVNPMFNVPDTRTGLPVTEEILQQYHPSYASLDEVTKANMIKYGTFFGPAGPYATQFTYNGPSEENPNPTPQLFNVSTTGGYLDIWGPGARMSMSPTTQNYQTLSNIINPQIGSPFAMPRIKMAYQTPTINMVPQSMGGADGGQSFDYSQSQTANPYWDPQTRAQYGMQPLTTAEQRMVGDWYINQVTAGNRLPIPNYVANILPLGVLGVGTAPLGTGAYP